MVCPGVRKQASSGEVQVGPLGLLSLLETKLGLTGPGIHPAVRIDQYMHRMELQDHPDKWFHTSFQCGCLVHGKADASLEG